MVELEPCSLDAPKNATYTFQRGTSGPVIRSSFSR